MIRVPAGTNDREQFCSSASISLFAANRAATVLKCFLNCAVVISIGGYCTAQRVHRIESCMIIVIPYHWTLLILFWKV